MAINMQPYVYEPLSSGQYIRLLKLEHGAEKEPIRLSLRTISLDDQPAYYAVSYTWNGADLTDTVECYDEGHHIKELKINSGSRLVLEKFRNGEYRDAKLWIDAICINQADRPERESQIQLMKAIYSRAETTLVYLGEPKEPGNLAIQLGEKIIEMMKKFEPGYQIKISELEQYGLPQIESPEWRSLYDLFCQPWFSRVWIRQEYILSRKVQMLYGGEWKPSDFYVTIDYTFNHSTYGLGTILQTIRQTDASRIPAEGHRFWPEVTVATLQLSVMDVTRAAIRTELPLKIPSPFLRDANIKATDQRDYVYGVLGLLDETEAYHPDLRPNYALGVSQTYTKAARYLLAKEGLEKFLRSTGYPRTIPSLPSWVPDWSTAKVSSYIDIPQVRSKFYAGGVEESIWRANVDSSHPILTICGTISDEIVEVSRVRDMKKGSANGYYVAFFWHTLEMLLQHQKLRKPSDVLKPSELAEIHIRTYTLAEPATVVPMFLQILKLAAQERRPSESEKKDLKLAVARSKSGQAVIEISAEPTSSPPPTNFQTITELLQPLYEGGGILRITEEEKRNMSQYIGALNLASSYLGFCVTSKGYVGRVPIDALKDDKICYFRGISKPCIIRNHPDLLDSYTYVGQCYIDGMMNGEAFHGEDIKLLDIDLV